MPQQPCTPASHPPTREPPKWHRHPGPQLMAGTTIIEIVSVNMQKCNPITHTLLNSAENTNIFLIQEPWFGKIGTTKTDNNRKGTDTFGGVATAGWEALYLGLKTDQKPKVMAYV